MYKERPEITEIIKRYRKQLQELGVTARETILFGSYAKGNPREDSDIDLLIISDDFYSMDLRRRIEVLGISAARIMKPVEALGYTADEITKISPASFLSEVLKIGVRVV